jgi:hypothetical protein
MHLKNPSGLGRDSESESESETTEAPQPCTVEAMCKAKWPTQRRSTEAQQAALKRVATHGREGGASSGGGHRVAKGARGHNRVRLGRRNRARSRPCARPTGLHKSDRSKRSEPPWRGPPRDARRWTSWPFAARGGRRRRGGPCLDERESGIGHLTMLATPPVL